MGGILFLTDDDIIRLNQRAVRRSGGVHALLRPELLAAANAMPRAGLRDGYLHESLAAMAAAYLYHLVTGHPFQDGNKRTAVYAALVFLDINGCLLRGDVAELKAVVELCAEGRMPKPEVIRFFEERVEEGLIP